MPKEFLFKYQESRNRFRVQYGTKIYSMHILQSPLDNLWYIGFHPNYGFSDISFPNKEKAEIACMEEFFLIRGKLKSERYALRIKLS